VLARMSLYARHVSRSGPITAAQSRYMSALEKERKKLQWMEGGVYACQGSKCVPRQQKKDTRIPAKYNNQGTVLPSTENIERQQKPLQTEQLKHSLRYR
jgi:hypothetical protein